jgi:sulfur-oxidizing protein SoxY
MRRQTSTIVLATAVAFVIGVSSVANAAGEGLLPDDPLGSPMWRDMARKFFDGAEVVVDPRVKITIPTLVENQAQVPVTADAREVQGVVRLIVFADLNPIQHVLTLTPRQAAPYVSFRMKVEQGTPVRAAALTADGVWHVGGVFLDAAGGGCSAPAMARQDKDWSQTVGLAQGRAWRQADGTSRVRFRVRHPMDTGLAKDNTPAFYIEKLEMRSPKGDGLASLELFEPVSEDPTLTLIVRQPRGEGAVDVEGRDNNGAVYRSTIPTGVDQSALGSATALQ